MSPYTHRGGNTVAWQSPEFDDHEQVCTFFDRRTGLLAIAAIHSTALGPAVGGTHFRPYSQTEEALRLSRAMSYKWALSDVSLGGGKVVIPGDPGQIKSRPLLHAYGHFLNRIGQQYSTGDDVGFSVADCEIPREVSPFVAGTASAGAGDPSIHTARGVFDGLRAVLETRFNRADFRGARFAVHGLGSVGWQVCKLLHEAGARLTVADIQSETANRARIEFAATIVRRTLSPRFRRMYMYRALSAASLIVKPSTRFVRRRSRALPTISFSRLTSAKNCDGEVFYSRLTRHQRGRRHKRCGGDRNNSRTRIHCVATARRPSGADLHASPRHFCARHETTHHSGGNRNAIGARDDRSVSSWRAKI
jgi:hypothetical protein